MSNHNKDLLLSDFRKVFDAIILDFANKDLNKILGSDSGFSFETALNNNDKFLTLYLVKDGKMISAQIIRSMNLIDTSELIAVAIRVLRENNHEGWKFASPSNQIKPFLTPLQEIGINE